MAARGGDLKGIHPAHLLPSLSRRRPLGAGLGLGILGAQMAVSAFFCFLGPCVPAQQGARSGGGMAQQGRGEGLTRTTWQAFTKVLSLFVVNALKRALKFENIFAQARGRMLRGALRGSADHRPMGAAGGSWWRYLSAARRIGICLCTGACGNRWRDVWREW
jgi:hypothetical protein